MPTAEKRKGCKDPAGQCDDNNFFELLRDEKRLPAMSVIVMMRTQGTNWSVNVSMSVQDRASLWTFDRTALHLDGHKRDDDRAHRGTHNISLSNSPC